MTPTHKICAKIDLEIPKFDDPTTFVVIRPRVIEARWTRNNHLIADELSVTLGYKEAGIDPRYVKNARCSFYMWDDAKEDFDPVKHVRFTGIGQTVERKLADSGWEVEMQFHDFTSLFLACKPMKSAGMPYYTDTLRQIWERICDNTGWTDPATGQIKSSVEALRGGLKFRVSDLESKTLADLVPDRFRAIGRPHPRQGRAPGTSGSGALGLSGLFRTSIRMSASSRPRRSTSPS